MFVVRDGNGTACVMANFSAAFLTSYGARSGPKVGGARVLRALCVRVKVIIEFQEVFKK